MYIPYEVLDIPELKVTLPLTLIKAVTTEQLLDAIINLSSNIALSAQTLDDIMSIIKANKFNQSFVQSIENRELKALLYDFYDVVPTNPVEFLRYIISKLTDESLLIKNDYLIKKIKEANGKFLDVLLKDAPEDLASIFFRYKPLFLALKSISGNKTYFNQLRKKAATQHKALPNDYLNSVTFQIKQGLFDEQLLQKKLENAPIFRKIRLAYSLNHRLYASNCTVYRVRNGKGWATKFDWPDTLLKTTKQALDIVLESIVMDIQSNVKDKIFYIPSYIHYALPATEKQFTGNLPSGTSVSVPEDMIVGIHWFNNDEKRVDLDLSIISETGKIGWDATYRSDDNQVLFSGDITDAPQPNGASELFYLRAEQQEARILWVNYYNFIKGDETETKILVAHETPKNFGKNYMVDINNIIASANINITKKQNLLGLIACKDGDNRLYFANINLGSSITSTQNIENTYARKYLIDSMTNTLDLKEILEKAGATVINKKTDDDYYDLSPERLDKTTIIDLIKIVTQ